MSGSWVNATVNNCNIAIALDTFCFENIIALDIARGIGCDIYPYSQKVKGVGGATVELSGLATVKTSIGGISKQVEFKVTDGIQGFAFVGLNEMKRWGMVIDAATETVNFRDRRIPFFETKANLMSSCAAMGSEDPSVNEPKGFTVRLTESIVVPPMTDMVVNGIIKESESEVPNGEYRFDPVTLKQRYGMIAPRAVVTVRSDRQVPLMLKNPFPVSIRLFRQAEVGLLFETEIIDTEHIKDMNAPVDGQEDISPDDHPISSLKLDHLSDDKRAKVEDMLKKRYKAFSRGTHDLGFTDWIVHDIELKEGQQEPVAEPQRSYPIHKRQIIDDTVQELLDQDVIEAATSSWRCWPVLASKRCDLTKQWIPDSRFCLDTRILNSRTIKHARLLPKVSEVIDCMGDACYFTKIDLQSAYHQVGLTERAKDMVSFCIPGGRQFRQKRMCFGLVNAGATFQSLMDMVLTGLSYSTCLAYLDDVVVWSKSFEDHVRDVDVVLRRLENAGLKAKTKKCELFVDEIDILGHKVNKHGVFPDPMKVKCVENWPVPEDVSEVLSFLAFANFYRRSIQDYSKRSWILNRLTHKNVPWSWTARHQSAFDDIKKALCEAPVMMLPDITKKFYLDTDYSRKGIGWVLQQEGEDGRLHPILYGSRSLSQRHVTAVLRVNGLPFIVH